MRQRMAELAKAESLTDETRSELDRIETGTPDLERQIRAARGALDAEEAESVVKPGAGDGDAPDAETRARDALRARVSIGRFLAMGVKGARLDGAEEEFRQAVGATERSIPIDAFEEPRREHRADVATAAPSTTGLNMTGVVPAAFSGSIAPRIGITMPRVGSGKYSVPRLTTNLTAGTKAKGADQESTAGAFTVASTGPTRISARLSLRAEDLAEVGIPGFEGALRQNLRLVLGDKLDEQIVRGNGTDPNVNGLASQLTADTDPTAVVTFASFIADMAGLIDGKWATTLKDIRLATNATVYQKIAATFQQPVAIEHGSPSDGYGVGGQSVETAADWAHGALGGLFCNSRMAAAASDISKCIAMRAGMMLDPPEAAAMPAVCPFWGDLEITDPYSDSGSATQHVTLHLLLGDVLIRQPDAFAEVRVKTA